MKCVSCIVFQIKLTHFIYQYKIVICTLTTNTLLYINTAYLYYQKSGGIIPGQFIWVLFLPNKNQTNVGIYYYIS